MEYRSPFVMYGRTLAEGIGGREETRKPIAWQVLHSMMWRSMKWKRNDDENQRREEKEKMEEEEKEEEGEEVEEEGKKPCSRQMEKSHVVLLSLYRTVHWKR